MSRQTILEFPDTRLRETSSPVTEFGAHAAGLVEDLLETLYGTTAIALSAPQIDRREQVLVMDLSGEKSAPQVFINPEILGKRAWGFVEESCLSLPGVTGSFIRATEVLVRAHDVEGKPFERALSGMEAVCLQHEMDHLVGKLFVDKMSVFKRLSVRAQAAARSRKAATAA